MANLFIGRVAQRVSTSLFVLVTYSLALGTPQYGGTDIDLIVGGEAGTHVYQATSVSWGHANTVVVLYDDSTAILQAPSSFCGASVSTDGGATFSRLAFKFNSGVDCEGEPSLVYSNKASEWIATFMSAGCGGLGIISYTSPDGINWTKGPCVHTNNNDDLPSIAVDNNPGSPFYGNLYVVFSNYNVGAGAPTVARSTDNGATWTAGPALYAAAPLHRATKIAVSPGTDGTVYTQELNENNGGLNTRQPILRRSTDGGLTFPSSFSESAAFAEPGSAVCTTNAYFVCMFSSPSQWYEMGWGEMAAGPNGVLHYVTTIHGNATDVGDIYYTRSTDFGTTWSALVKLNTDPTATAQWQPSVSANASGLVFVNWFDMRNGSGTIEVYGRSSTDSGVTWNAEQPVTDAPFPRPAQPDANIPAAFMGFYHHNAFSNDNTGNTAYVTWVDGRVLIGGSAQPDVFFDKVTVSAPTAANVTVSGRITDNHGRGLRQARVTIDDSRGNTLRAVSNAFGYYTITSVPSGDTYIASVSARGFTFGPRALSVTDSVAGFDFSP